MATTPEGKVKNQVKAALKARGIWFYMPMQTGFGVVGIPDFICCWNGKMLAIETKAPGKRSNTTPNQDMRIAEIRAAGGLAIVVDALAQLLEVLDEAKA